MRKYKIKESKGDRSFYTVNSILLCFLTLVVLYPLVVVFSSSFSSAAAVSSGKVFLWPIDFSVEGYKRVLDNKNVFSGFANSIFYTALGTLVNITVTYLAAYPLARKDLPL